MKTKLIGMIMAGVGLIGLASSSIPILKTKIPSLPFLSGKNLIIASLILIILGAFLFFPKKGSQKHEEVPIYEGKQIVGYRRH